MTAEAPATRADVLREITRQVVDRGLPTPMTIDFDDTVDQGRIWLKFGGCDELDEWAKLLGHKTRVDVYEQSGQPYSWQYRNVYDSASWLGHQVTLSVRHDIPQGDDLVEQPVGGEAR